MKHTYCICLAVWFPWFTATKLASYEPANRKGLLGARRDRGILGTGKPRDRAPAEPSLPAPSEFPPSGTSSGEGRAAPAASV